MTRDPNPMLKELAEINANLARRVPAAEAIPLLKELLGSGEYSPDSLASKVPDLYAQDPFGTTKFVIEALAGADENTAVAFAKHVPFIATYGEYSYRDAGDVVLATWRARHPKYEKRGTKKVKVREAIAGALADGRVAALFSYGKEAGAGALEIMRFNAVTYRTSDVEKAGIQAIYEQVVAAPEAPGDNNRAS